MNEEVFEQLLDIVEYQLGDGASLPMRKRTFETDEYDLIFNVIQYVRNTLHNKNMVDLARRYAEMGKE